MYLSQKAILLIHDKSDSSRELHSLLSSKYFSLIGPALTGEMYLSLDVLRQYDAIVVMAGDLFPKIKEDFVEVITTYVERGGTLLAMPFLAWSVENQSNTSLDRLLPVACKGFFENETISWEIDKSVWERTPQHFEFRASAEILETRSGAQEYARDIVHNSSALVSWTKKKGIVIYLNVTHHVHGHKPIPVWTIPELPSLIISCLEEEFFTKRLRPREKAKTEEETKPHTPKASSIRGYFSHTPHVTDSFTDRDEFVRAFVEKTARARHEHHFMHAATHFDEVSSLILSKSEARRQELAKKRPWDLYWKLSARIPEWPFLFLNENDYGSMTRIERIHVCRSLLKILRSSRRMKRIFETIWWPHEKTGFDQWKGNILELFGCLFFLTEPGLSVINKKVTTPIGEIDILIQNESNLGLWQQLGSPIGVVCKTWFEKGHTRDITIFRDKLQHLGIETGFLLSQFGVTRKEFQESDSIIKDAMRDRGINIIVLTFSRIAETLKYHSITDHISRIYYKLYQ